MVLEHLTSDDPDIAELILVFSVTNDDRLDTMDPLAVLEHCESIGITITDLLEYLK